MSILNAWTLYLVVANQFISMHKLESKSPTPHKPDILTLALIYLFVGCKGFATKYPYSILSVSWDEYTKEVMLSPTSNSACGLSILTHHNILPFSMLTFPSQPNLTPWNHMVLNVGNWVSKRT